MPHTLLLLGSDTVPHTLLLLGAQERCGSASRCAPSNNKVCGTVSLPSNNKVCGTVSVVCGTGSPYRW